MEASLSPSASPDLALHLQDLPARLNERLLKALTIPRKFLLGDGVVGHTFGGSPTPKPVPDKPRPKQVSLGTLFLPSLEARACAIILPSLVFEKQIFPPILVT